MGIIKNGENILRVLLDKNNRDLILINTDRFGEVEFEQKAIVPFGDGLYCLLKPAKKLAGIKESDVFVFRVAQDKNLNPILVIEEDFSVCKKIFNEVRFD